MKKLFSSLAAVSIASAAFAGTFTDNGGQGVSIVDAVNPVGADYSSLAAAAADFTNFSGGATGDWTLLIRSDLTEPVNVAFGNETNGNTITVRPAPATTPVITFTTTTANPGYNSHILIGSKSADLSGDILTTTSNFILDGSNTPGGTTRDLRMTNISTEESTSPNRIMVRVVGACDGVQIKNLIIDNLTTGVNEAYGVDFNSRKTASLGEYLPQNGRVENCEINVPGARSGSAIAVRVQGAAPTPGVAPSGFVITGNTVTAQARGIYMTYAGQAEITNNVITIANGTTVRPEALFHGGATGVGGWTTTIANNHIAGVRGADTATGGILSCISIGSGIVSPVAAQYDVYNNMIGGLDVSGTVITTSTGNNPSSGLYRAFIVEGANSLLTVNLHHNSINMPNYANLSPPNIPGRYNAVSINGIDWNGTFNMTNNIIRMEQNNGVVLFKNPGGAGTVNSNYNVFHLGTEGARMASYNVGNTNFSHTTLANWQASGFDILSFEANPTVANAPATGKWISDSDLHFDAEPGNFFGGAPVTGITTDIDGDTRSATVPYVGADERAEPLSRITAASDWSMFQ